MLSGNPDGDGTDNTAELQALWEQIFGGPPPALPSGGGSLPGLPAVPAPGGAG